MLRGKKGMTYDWYMVPMIVNEIQAMTAALVMVVTALGIIGSSRLASRYASAIIRAIKVVIKIGQQTIPVLPCSHVIYPQKRRKMQEIPRSASVKLITCALGAAMDEVADSVEDMTGSRARRRKMLD